MRLNTSHTLPLIIGLMLIIQACNQPSSKEEVKGNNTTTVDTVPNEVESLIKESENYLKNRDFDGDGTSDLLVFSYTGGAHCCYKMHLKLSSLEDTIHYPFEMDGGYGFGIVDGSQHDQFNIDDYDADGLPEIFMTISTYNGEKYPITKEWTADYGIKTNHILFDYKQDKIVLTDYDQANYVIKH